MSARISEILWRAANEHLWDGCGSAFDTDSWKFSCDAISGGVGHTGVDSTRALNFIAELGCPRDSHHAFDEFEDDEEAGPESQGARYAWLMFASMVAAEMEEAGEL